MKPKHDRTERIGLSAAAVMVFGTALCCAAITANLVAESKAYLLQPGDVNTDSQVDVMDAIALARVCSEDHTIQLTDIQRRNADVDMNTLVDANDLSTLMRQLAGMESIHAAIEIPDETETTTATTETTTSTSETTTTTTTSATTTEATTTTTETTVYVETTIAAEPELTVEEQAFPLGVSVSKLTGQQQPNEMLTVGYGDSNRTFAIFADDPAHTLIAITENDTIVGYYAFGTEYTAPEGYVVTQFFDTYSDGSGELYAILALREGVSVRFRDMLNPSDLTVYSKISFYGTNAIRAQHGLEPYTWDGQLAQVAWGHSQEMADLNYFDHASADGSKFSLRLKAAGLEYYACGENIDCGYPDTFSALHGWFISETGHRDNILNERYTRMGVGFAYGADSRYKFYGTQDFYLPKS